MKQDDSRAWLLTSTPESNAHLYHYTSAEKLAMILDKVQLRLSPLSQTNDPCEFNEWFADLFFSSQHSGSLDADVLEIEQAMYDIDDRLRKNVCVGCFTVDRAPRKEADEGSWFHMGWARARMWDQYANHHAGAVLIFDPVDLLVSVEDECRRLEIDCERGQGRVHYYDQKRGLAVALDAIQRDGVDAVIERMRTAQHASTSLYYRKNFDWASEEEYRIMVVRSFPKPEDLEEPLYVPLADSLQAIVLGERFPETELSVLRHRKGASGIPLYRCVWVDGSPILEVEE